MGFAPNIGDPFTYKVWTVDSSNGTDRWEDGKELIRNVVIRRQTGERPPTQGPPTGTVVEVLAFESSRARKPTCRRQDSRSKAVRNTKAAMAAAGSKRPATA